MIYDFRKSKHTYGTGPVGTPSRQSVGRSTVHVRTKSVYVRYKLKLVHDVFMARIAHTYVDEPKWSIITWKLSEWIYDEQRDQQSYNAELGIVQNTGTSLMMNPSRRSSWVWWWHVRTFSTEWDKRVLVWTGCALVNCSTVRHRSCHTVGLHLFVHIVCVWRFGGFLKDMDSLRPLYQIYKPSDVREALRLLFEPGLF